MDKNSDFQRAIVEYLEGCHIGDFGDKTSDEVGQTILQHSLSNPLYKDPTLTLPSCPPTLECVCNNYDCVKCLKQNNWWAQYKDECDDLAYRSNKHKQCSQSKGISKGCLDKNDNCKG